MKVHVHKNCVFSIHLWILRFLWSVVTFHRRDTLTLPTLHSHHKGVGGQVGRTRHDRTGLETTPVYLTDTLVAVVTALMMHVPGVFHSHYLVTPRGVLGELDDQLIGGWTGGYWGHYPVGGVRIAWRDALQVGVGTRGDTQGVLFGCVFVCAEPFLTSEGRERVRWSCSIWVRGEGESEIELLHLPRPVSLARYADIITKYVSIFPVLSHSVCACVRVCVCVC